MSQHPTASKKWGSTMPSVSRFIWEEGWKRNGAKLGKKELQLYQYPSPRKRMSNGDEGKKQIIWKSQQWTYGYHFILNLRYKTEMLDFAELQQESETPTPNCLTEFLLHCVESISERQTMQGGRPWRMAVRREMKIQGWNYNRPNARSEGTENREHDGGTG